MDKSQLRILTPVQCHPHLAVPLDDAQLVELSGDRLVNVAEEEVLLHLVQSLGRALAPLLPHQEVHLNYEVTGN